MERRGQKVGKHAGGVQGKEIKRYGHDTCMKSSKNKFKILFFKKKKKAGSGDPVFPSMFLRGEK